MPNIEFLTEKRFTLSSHLIEVALKNNLSLIEFLLLMYFEDTDDKTLNVSKISKVLSLFCCNSLILFLLISNPITFLYLANSIANGKPTYPKPIIAKFILFIFCVVILFIYLL